MKLGKILPLLGALCATAFSSAFASTGSSSYGSAMDSNNASSGSYQRGTFREITPAAGPRVAHGADVFVTANFIWWNAKQEGLKFATSAVPASSHATKGVIEEIKGSWEPGFKVGLGLNLSHDGWDLYTQYTWLNANRDQSISAGSNVIGSTFQILASDATITKASGTWDLHFNVIDLELGRNFYLSQFLTMRPFVGVKGTWQDQNTQIQYDGSGFHSGASTISSGPYTIKNQDKSWGLGARAGLNFAYYMGKNWSVFGNLAWTTLWADYEKLQRHDVLKDRETNTNTVDVLGENTRDYAVRYVAESELGMRWETWFCDDSYHFSVQAGWEQQSWLNWSQIVPVSVNEGYHDLSLQGLNLKFRFDF